MCACFFLIHFTFDFKLVDYYDVIVVFNIRTRNYLNRKKENPTVNLQRRKFKNAIKL